MGRAALAGGQLLAGLVRLIEPGACCVRLIEPGALPWLVASRCAGRGCRAAWAGLPVLVASSWPGVCRRAPDRARCAAPWLVARLVLPVLLCAKLPGTCPSASRCA